MDEQKIIKILNKAKDIKMTANEKLVIKQNLEVLVKATPSPFGFPPKAERPRLGQQIRSPYLFGLSFFAKGLVLAALVLVIGGGSLSFAAEGALPGDWLYPIKINVNEKAKEITLRTSEARVAWQEKRIERRLEELDKLVADNKINPAVTKVVENYLGQQMKDFDNAVINVSDDKIEVAVEATSRVSTLLNTHRVLAKIRQRAESKDGEYKEVAKVVKEKALFAIRNQKQKVETRAISKIEKENEEALNNLDKEIDEELENTINKEDEEKISNSQFPIPNEKGEEDEELENTIQKINIKNHFFKRN
jgi:hypothetical protein